MSCDFCQCCPGHGYLPQYGFGPEVEFKRLVERNVFLFRVHTPRPSASLLDAPFTARKFDARHSVDAASPMRDPPPATYAEVARHMDWTSRYASVYVSTSFSFMWAVWEALRRYHFGVKHDVEIAVIDANAVADASITVVEILRSAPPAARHADHWKWYHTAQEAQSVLVYGRIPQSAILASIPLLTLLDALPSYCLRQPPLATAPPAAIDRVSWSYPRGKPSFHVFCTAQAALFRRAPPDARFDDATAGAVRLARAFLGGWVHWMQQLPPPPGSEGECDARLFCDAAATKVAELACAIARWPAAGETHELWERIVREIARLVAEEGQAHQRVGASEGLDHGTNPPVDSHLHGPNKTDDECADVWILDPRTCLPTPPPTPPPSLVTRDSTATAGLRVPALSPLQSFIVVEASSGKHTDPLEVPESKLPAPTGELAEKQLPKDETSSPALTAADVAHEILPSSRPPLQFHSVGETASCLLTGFLFGALIIVVLSSQRRPALLYVS
ncbi:hypothetical protein GGX14DRAFT_520385 [Mycena pura]|uniref:DUF7587 domain-containing protein n=1 Tax=Mycena pura TaxID=153505 RepID=A0AAD6YHW3_9AGAR|nr:hypothetical protein GGX14DRAFT_520385 [Mycena pura]